MNDKKIVSKKNSDYFFTEVYIVYLLSAEQKNRRHLLVRYCRARGGRIILSMSSANEGRRYNITTSLISSAYKQNDRWKCFDIRYDLTKPQRSEISV